MNFATTDGKLGIGFSSGESSVLKSADESMRCPADLMFRRIYLGWLHYQIGEPEIQGTIFLKRKGNTLSTINFGWYENIVASNAAGRFLPNLFVPGFTVNRRPYGSGNSYPYELPASPDCKVIGLTYAEFSPSALTYNAQITIQPFRLAEQCDEVAVHLECRAGTITANNGLLAAVMSVDSCRFPF